MGTYVYGSDWFVLDQVLCSRGLLIGGPIRFVRGSVRAVAIQSVAAQGRSTVATTGRGSVPMSFDASSGAGVSDHLPLACEIECD